MNYYYLAASLPPLVLGETPHMPSAEFLKHCREQLSPRETDAIESVFASPTPEPPHALLRDWNDRETQLRNAVATQRARALQQNPAAFLRTHEDFETGIEKGVADAFAVATPLDRELAIDTIRWRTAEELGGTNEFSTRAIVAYALKLKIAERWAAMDEEAGSSQADMLIGMPPAEATESADQQET